MNEKVKTDLTKRLVQFSLSVIKLSKTTKLDISHRVIFDQLIRSATSIGANVVEAKGASSRKDFTNYYQIAFKSACETKYWLFLLQQSDPELKEITTLLQEAEEIAKIIGASLITLKNK